MTARDIIRDIIERLMAHEASITEELALKVEHEARAHWGGQAPYVPKETKRQAHVRQKVFADALTAMPTAEVIKRHGISRRTLYRLLKKPPEPTDA
jgi:Mor family transcriptional regulator